MIKSAPNPQNPNPPAAEEAPDADILRAEQRLAMLRELAEIGMRLARAIEARAAESDAGADGDTADGIGRARGRDPADAFAPLSRAIRLTIALEARIDAELRDLKSGVVREPHEEQEHSASRAAATANDRFFIERRANLRHLVREAAEFEIADAEALREVCHALEEHLQCDYAYQDIARRPLRESVERLCRDLKLEPDWRRWQGDRWNHAVPSG